MQLHWKVLLWMLAGVLIGLAFQSFLSARSYGGAEWKTVEGGLELVAAKGPAAKVQSKDKAGPKLGEVFSEVILRRGTPEERRQQLATPQDYTEALAVSANGDTLWFVAREGGEPRALTLELHPDCRRAKWIAPFTFAADIFLLLLKMLIVPLILTSIVSGVAGVGGLKDLRRLGLKTFTFYFATSLLAILVGQTLVNVIRPGENAVLGLSPNAEAGAREENFASIFTRMVPENVVEAMTHNGAMLQVIFFALLLGYFITRAQEPHSSRMREFFESAFEVMMGLAKGVLKLLPYGVFALLVKVVASTGFGVFKPLLLYMGTVTAALVIHSCITLPLILRFVGGISPLRWFKAMSPAIMTAFSTSSSNMTLPVSLRTVEKRGRVSNKVSSFTLPLGATINMDGTALYECIGVIFLAQYYASMGGEVLSFTAQATVVLMALLASVGAAGIPSAGLVMMLTILSALKLPLEGAALLLAVDRPLDMMRTMVNVWSDTCGAAVVSRSEGEVGPAEL